ncbi:dihydrofolate reductase family protein [Nocardia sp. NBC_00511]|uniref:dihydrofolate reductase family protein n=1 Tax=Nocardia sp. NBC_00511 TaxID=2903591 RepID=UPI0030E1221F
MRKVVALEHVTLDGFVDSHTGSGFEWTHRGYSEELAEYGDQHIRADVDAALYGRRTFEGMRDFWSTVADNPEMGAHEKDHAEWVTEVDKYVFSNTLKEPGWNNTRVISGDAAAQVRALKAQDGGTLSIYASPKLVHWFIAEGLVDEFRVMIHPLTVGSGTPLFPEKAALNLNVLETKVFDTGVVYARYQIA